MNFVNGPLAQLGERYTGSVEVVGSIPIGSTIKLPLNAWISERFLFFQWRVV